MTTDSDAELLTVAEAAKVLKVSTVTLDRWLKDGRLPAYHVGPRAVRIRRGVLRRILVPTHGREEVTAMDDSQAMPVHTTVRPLTDEEIQRGLAALEVSRKLGERILARRGGQPLDESWPIIREAREERSKELL